MRLKGLATDLAIGIIAISAVLALSTTMPLGIFNAKLTDTFLYVSPAPDFSPKTFVIENTGNADLTNADINSLVQNVNAAGADHILILDNYSQTIQNASGWPDNVHIASSGAQEFEDADPDALKLFELHANNRNYRSFSLEQRDNSILTLLDVSDSSPETTQQAFRAFFNFAVRPGLLPNITTQQALNGGIIRALVEDKLVFIQVSPSQQYERFAVAQSLEASYLTYVEMQALAVENIVHNLHLETFPLIITALFLLTTYFAVFFLLQVFNSNGIMLFEGAQLLAALLLAYLFFVSFHLVFPFGEFFLAQLMALLQFLMSERRRESRILSSRTAKLQSRLSQRMLPDSFLKSEQPWKDLHVFIDQHLHMQRSILLDRVKEDHRVVAIHALNCTVDDIQERRRDFQREPYSSAVRTQRPVRLESTSYFKDVAAREVEYMVPLMFAGDVLGFWALTIEPDENWNPITFEQNLVSFSRELSELLYHRSKFVESRGRESRWLRQVINLNYAVKEQRQLDSAIELLERRLGLLQNVFSRSSSALALYNLFGQVLTSNQKMNKIASALELKFFTMSAHDLLVELTGEQSATIKKMMLQITLHHRSVEWPISSPKLESDYILRVLPIERETQLNDEVSPFSLAGILFEFVDVHSMQQAVESRRELHRYYFDRLESDFAAIKQLSDQLAQASDSNNQQHLEQLNSLVDAALSRSSTVERMLELQQHSNEIFPVKPANLITERVQKLSGLLEGKSIEFDYHWPEIPILALVSVEQFKQLLDAILRLLIKDSDSTDGLIRIDMKDCLNEGNCRRIQIDFVNKGYGVPKEQLQSIKGLSNIELASENNDLFNTLYLARQVEDWGAWLELTSKLGKGYEIKLFLPTFEADISRPDGD